MSVKLEPAEHYSAAYERDLIAVREHVKDIATYLLQAGLTGWQVESVMSSVIHAAVRDAQGRSTA